MMVANDIYLIFILSLVCADQLFHGFTADGTFAEYTVSRSMYLNATCPE